MSDSDQNPDQPPGPASDPDRLTFGWEEWVALPELGLPAISAKVDTGARTSALHASDIETFGTEASPKVRFMVCPIAGRDDLSIACSADIIDRREVTSSNGEAEMRYVIGTCLEVAGQQWPIEVTLSNRSGMASRMLLGRQALIDKISISATERLLQPVLSYDVYHSADAPFRAKTGITHRRAEPRRQLFDPPHRRRRRKPGTYRRGDRHHAVLHGDQRAGTGGLLRWQTPAAL